MIRCVARVYSGAGLYIGWRGRVVSPGSRAADMRTRGRMHGRGGRLRRDEGELPHTSISAAGGVGDAGAGFDGLARYEGADGVSAGIVGDGLPVRIGVEALVLEDGGFAGVQAVGGVCCEKLEAVHPALGEGGDAQGVGEVGFRRRRDGIERGLPGRHPPRALTQHLWRCGIPDGFTRGRLREAPPTPG